MKLPKLKRYVLYDIAYVREECPMSTCVYPSIPALKRCVHKPLSRLVHLAYTEGGRCVSMVALEKHL